VSPSRKTLLACGVLTLITLAVYAGTWSHPFVNFDDDVTIVNLELIRELSFARLPAFFEPAIRRGLPEYMPLKNLSYAVDYALFGLWAPGFRVQQQLWYLASVLLFFLWTRALLVELAERGRLVGITPGRAPLAALAAALLFALHPAHVESVTWLSGRKDVLSGAFMLGALLCAWRGSRAWLGGALVCTVLALLSKPTAVILPGLLLLQDLLRERPLRALLRERGAFHALCLVLCGGFAAFYVSFTAEHAAAGGQALEQLKFAGPAWSRWGQQYAAFLGVTLLPLSMSPIQPPGLLDASPTSESALLGLCVLALIVVGGLLALRRRSPWLLPLGLFVIPLLPVVLSPPWGQYVAGRYLFHALGGVCIGLVLGGARLLVRTPVLRPVVFGVLGLLALGYAAVTVDYNATWSSSSALWEGALRHHPRFTRLHDMAARAHGLEGHPERAVAVLARCLEVAPEDAPCLTRMGKLLLGPNPKQGERMLRRALPLDATDGAARALAEHMLQTGRAKQALPLYEKALSGKGANTASFDLLIRLSLAAERPDKALEYCKHMVRAAAVNHPGSPAPVAQLRFVARTLDDAELARRVEQAIGAGCLRSDCFRQHMGGSGG
jgi:tetratricopeptide (TPR) repeat protein